MDDFEEAVEELKSKAREVAREPFTVPAVGTRGCKVFLSHLEKAF